MVLYRCEGQRSMERSVVENKNGCLRGKYLSRIRIEDRETIFYEYPGIFLSEMM
jgi:hypothetical protein